MKDLGDQIHAQVHDLLRCDLMVDNALTSELQNNCSPTVHDHVIELWDQVADQICRDTWEQITNQLEECLSDLSDDSHSSI